MPTNVSNSDGGGKPRPPIKPMPVKPGAGKGTLQQLPYKQGSGGKAQPMPYKPGSSSPAQKRGNQITAPISGRGPRTAGGPVPNRAGGNRGSLNTGGKIGGAIGAGIGQAAGNVIGGIGQAVGGVAGAIGGAANAAGKMAGQAVRQGQRVAGGAIGGAVKGAQRGFANGGPLGALGGAQVGALRGAGKALAGKPKSNSYNGTGGIPKEASGRRSGTSSPDRVERMAPKKFGDSNRSSMAPKGKPGFAGSNSNFGPGKIPKTAQKNVIAKSDSNVQARTMGLAKQGLIKGQASGAGIPGNKATGSAPKKRTVDPGNIIKKRPVSQPVAKPVAKKPAAKAPVASGGGGGGRGGANLMKTM